MSLLYLVGNGSLCNPTTTGVLLIPQTLVWFGLFLRDSLSDPQTLYVAEAGFEFLILLSCLYLASAGTTGMHHHANLIFVF